VALIGAHVHSTDPLAHAAEISAEAVQFFLGDPQGWKQPPPHPHADALRATDLAVYIHAPYLVNVASTNNKIRIPVARSSRSTPPRRPASARAG